MVRKLIWWTVWPILGGLIIGWYFNQRNITIQHEALMRGLQQFKAVGPRFTAQDGQELCLRVQALDGLPCEYDQ